MEYARNVKGRVLFQTVNRGRRREFLSMHNAKVNS